MTAATRSPETLPAAAPRLSRQVGPAAALLLSALILPGLGQMVTGRLRRGALMSAVPLLWLPLAFVKVLRDLFAVLPDLTAGGGAVTLSGLQEALGPRSGDLLWLLAPVAAVWLWSLVDSIMFWRKR